MAQTIAVGAFHSSIVSAYARLRARNHVEALLLQRIAQAFREIYVAIDQQNARKIRGRVHRLASAPCELMRLRSRHGEAEKRVEIQHVERIVADRERSRHVCRAIHRRRLHFAGGQLAFAVHGNRAEFARLSDLAVRDQIEPVRQRRSCRRERGPCRTPGRCARGERSRPQSAGRCAESRCSRTGGASSATRPADGARLAACRSVAARRNSLRRCRAMSCLHRRFRFALRRSRFRGSIEPLKFLGVKSPVGSTTGITESSRYARPRYQRRSSPVKASGSGCTPEFRPCGRCDRPDSAARNWRRIRTSEGRVTGKPKCTPAFTT